VTNASRIIPDHAAFINPASAHSTWHASRSRPPPASCPGHEEVPRVTPVSSCSMPSGQLL
jgi:hypothetical protein